MAIPALAGVSGSDKIPGDRANSIVTGTILGVGPGRAFSIWGPMNIAFWGSRASSISTTAGSINVTGINAAIVAGDAVNSVNVPPGTTLKTVDGAGNGTLAFMPQTWPGILAGGVASITNMASGNPIGGVTSPANLAALVGATILSSQFPAGTTVTAVGPDGQSLLTSAPAIGTTGASPTYDQNVAQQIVFAPTGNCITTTGADAAATFTSGTAAQYNSTIQIERSFDGGRTWLAANIGGSGTIAKFSTNQVVQLAFGDPESGMLYRLNALTFGATSGITINYRMSTTGQASTSIALQTI